MTVELVNTGSELMLGRVLNTHQQWVCSRMADLGYSVSRQVAVPDNGSDIQQAVRESLSRSDLIITTGGLGPTSDDITRDLIAQLLERRLQVDDEAKAKIEKFFAARSRRAPAGVMGQALVPEGSIVLQNQHGTAPGLAIRISDNALRPGGGTTWLIMLPGPPRELRPMFTSQVVPLLQKELPMSELFLCKTLRTTGIGESQVEEQVGDELRRLVSRGLELGYCARPGQVDVRLVCRGPGAAEVISDAEKIVKEKVGDFVFGQQEDDLESVLVKALAAQGKTLSLAESCTGGGIANRITNVPGSSAVLLVSLVTYSNEAKQQFLGVKQETLARHGAVSEEVAREMAEGARRITNSDFSLAVTGIAGPGGGTPEKPVGTVFIGLASPNATISKKYLNPYDRITFKEVVAGQAMELLRRVLIAAKPT